MEGVGSRFGRASSRYGSAPTPAVFSGPVRKWKKQWVIVDLEEKKREALKKVENEANTRKMDKAASSATLGSGNMLKKHNINDIFNEDFQESS
nr:uncharacterized protein LOC109190452 [Ipomoea batatas]